MQPDTYQYILPTAETAPRFAAIRAAETACVNALIVTLYDHAELGGALSPTEKPKAWPESFAAVAEACRAFASVCAAVAPRSADLAAAERCIRLARMLSNEALGPVERERAKYLFGLALDELTKARMQACAAVALADAGELPAWEG
jgi:hypothetical protein